MQKLGLMEKGFEAMARLDHPNVLKVTKFGKRGSISKPNKSTLLKDLVYLQTPFISGGNFVDFLEQLGGKLTEEEARYFMTQVADLVDFLLSQKCQEANLQL